MKIGIVDYGAGNLFSVINALKFLNCDYIVCDTVKKLSECDKIILPGVGAFAAAMESLEKTGFADYLRSLDSNTQLLGICLGMQLLFEKSYEFGEHNGLGLIPGCVRLIPQNDGLRIPHLGWNEILLDSEDVIFSGMNRKFFYFIHSYYADTDNAFVTSYTTYGKELTASVKRDNIRGVQFHPEKSGNDGIELLRRFCSL